MFPFVSGREKEGAVLDPGTPGESADAGPGGSVPACQFRYSRKAPANTKASVRINTRIDTPPRDVKPLCIDEFLSFRSNRPSLYFTTDRIIQLMPLALMVIRIFTELNIASLGISDFTDD